MKNITKACLLTVAMLPALVQSIAMGSALGPDAANIADILEPIRKEYKLPALAAVVVSKGKVIGLGAVGERKYKSGVSVTTNDRFHLGSCTKAMTATMIGMLVERGKLRWDMTLAEALPGLAMNDGYRLVTIRHLLAHRAGLPNASWPSGKTFMDMHKLPGNPRQQRLTYAKLMLNQKPQAKPGEKYVYSNAGFAIAGVIAEEATDTAWEELMRTMLFDPLGMKTAGFGAMGTQGKIDEPWQHKRGLFGQTRAIAPGRYSDNPPVIAPAGTVHCSMGDWAKFVILHLEKGSFAGRQLIKPETLAELRKPYFGGNYAGGWGVLDRSWGGGRVFSHSGSNNQNYAVVWMAPLKRYAVLVVTNQGGGSEAKALDKVAATLIRKFEP
ncbi:MAG: beta-lactamase family protein [Planctomycetes bacterium]|nr:beta-lactamase family protein [Planctomycetota bacterium]